MSGRERKLAYGSVKQGSARRVAMIAKADERCESQVARLRPGEPLRERVRGLERERERYASASARRTVCDTTKF